MLDRVREVVDKIADEDALGLARHFCQVIDMLERVIAYSDTDLFGCDSAQLQDRFYSIACSSVNTLSACYFAF